MSPQSFIYLKFIQPIQILLDKLQGLDFLSVILPEEVGLDSKLAYRCSPSSKRFLKKVLTRLHITSQDSIIDIGCGKGYAMRTMLKFQFESIDGIELSAHIANIAIRNFKGLNSIKSRVFIEDAAQFKEYDAYNYVYFFNPFPPVVMSEVINSLIQSLSRSERKLVIIYMNPTCNDVIINNSVFVKTGEYFRRGNRIFIYTNRIHNNLKPSLNT